MTGLLAYTRERLLKGRIAALILLIALAALSAGGLPDGDGSRASTVLVALALATLLVAQFRLLDDLADRPVDRRHHPQRVLARAAQTWPFTMALAAAALPVTVALASLPGATARIAGYGLLTAAMLGWYRLRPLPLPDRPDAMPPAPAWLPLLKYPAFVLLIAQSPERPLLWLAAAAVYGMVVLHDELDQPPARIVDPRKGPEADAFEPVACHLCGSTDSMPLTDAQDDLTGKPGVFRFVTCRRCGLAYQSPRLALRHIGAYYDSEYIAHRKKTDWGWLTPLYRRAMSRHDRAKLALVRAALSRHRRSGDMLARALDVGCGSGSFAALLKADTGSEVEALDFKDMSDQPFMQGLRFHHGLFYEQDFGDRRFDLITMWHFLEHDYDPARTLATARDLLSDDGLLVIEVPCLDSVSWRLYKERWPGLQAPQHTVLYSRATLAAMAYAAGLEVVAHHAWGAFPAYFYLFAGAAFRLLRGRGLNLDRAIAPYFLGQLLLSPLLLFERHLNLAMQTIILRRPGQAADPARSDGP